MILAEKYQSVIDTTNEVSIQNPDAPDQDGKPHISGQIGAAYDASCVRDALKQVSVRDTEIQRDLPASNTEVHGYSIVLLWVHTLLFYRDLT